MDISQLSQILCTIETCARAKFDMEAEFPESCFSKAYIVHDPFESRLAIYIDVNIDFARDIPLSPVETLERFKTFRDREAGLLLQIRSLHPELHLEIIVNQLFI